MITISHKDETVTIEIDGRYPVKKWMYQFNHSRQTESDAALLVGNLREHLKSRIRAIKEAAYSRGWKDAKAKRRKKAGWFCGNWDLDQ